jgi:hypothetical protein
MEERDLYESMHNLNPCIDRLGKERDFKDSVMKCIKYLDEEIKELKRRLDEKAE